MRKDLIKLNALLGIILVVFLSVFIQTPYGRGQFYSFYFWFYVIVCPLFLPFYFIYLFQKQRFIALFFKTIILSTGTILGLTLVYVIYLTSFCDHAPPVYSFGCSAEPFPLVSIAVFFGAWNLLANFVTSIIMTTSFALFKRRRK